MLAVDPASNSSDDSDNHGGPIKTARADSEGEGAPSLGPTPPVESFLAAAVGTGERPSRRRAGGASESLLWRPRRGPSGPSRVRV